MPAGPQDSGRNLRDEVDRTVIPVTDIVETPAAFTIIADMPGVASDRLEVIAERDTLMVRGRVIRPSRLPQHREFDLADYAQTFTLTEDLDRTRIHATLKDGVLRISVPKSATVQPRRIEIHTD
jgi:HSP20 family protein